MTTRAQVESLPIGTKVRALVGGCGGVFTDDGDEEIRGFDLGVLLTIEALDSYDNWQGLAITVVAENGVVNVIDAGDFEGSTRQKAAPVSLPDPYQPPASSSGTARRFLGSE
jgi:hypothetical protein